MLVNRQSSKGSTYVLAITSDPAFIKLLGEKTLTHRLKDDSIIPELEGHEVTLYTDGLRLDLTESGRQGREMHYIAY